MISKGHGRSSSQSRKTLPPHARPSKPPPLSRRGTSFNHPHHPHSSTTTKSGSGWSKKSSSNHTDEDDDMASFLQFCATCEKQIVTPSSNLLYCSEACRKKDTLKSPPSIPRSPLLSPSRSGSVDASQPNILPQLSPTVLRPVSLTFSDLTISESGSPTDEFQPFYLRHGSDASAYLEQFHANTWSNASNIPPRTQPQRSNTGSETIPSLSHTPSSSVGTVASLAAPPPVRPLPSRTNPSYSSFSRKPIDLESNTSSDRSTSLAPSPSQLCKDASLKSCASTLTAFRVAEADVSYSHHHDDRRRLSNRRDSSAQASLRQLFSHDAMLK